MTPDPPRPRRRRRVLVVAVRRPDIEVVPDPAGLLSDPERPYHPLRCVPGAGEEDWRRRNRSR